ncbi:MAG: undecaprenyl-diphosphate phosphatase [bacterium]|nr:undecaprenyl-diphosphate phosphatase [bacterium]
MDIFELLKIVTVSVIEGVTEWLPVSSTGHMILFDELVKFRFTDDFKSLFLVVIQLGAILAVVYLYFEKLNPFSSLKTRYEKHKTWTLWQKVLVASIPAAILGFLLDDFIDAKLMNAWVVAGALIVYGVLFIVIERIYKVKKIQPKTKDLGEISYLDALKVGGFQLLALIPGTSRSGSTILGSRILGLSRETAAEFSFFMGIPVIFGASFLKIVKFGFNFTLNEISYLIFATTLTFWVSIFVIKFLMKFIKKHDFQAFGWYRIALGVIVLIFFLMK